jgi:2-oxoglutarate dehydrogenase E1 component
MELLYPFAAERLAQVLAGYPALEEVVWVQEEPQNMGAWTYMEPRLRALLAESQTRLAYIGRPERASPAEGFLSVHEEQQARLVDAAYTASLAAPRKRERAKRRG